MILFSLDIIVNGVEWINAREVFGWIGYYISPSVF